MFQLTRNSYDLYELRQSFEDAESMDRAYPDGIYTITWSQGSVPVAISWVPSWVAARVTNWDALQRWNGRDQLTVVLAPTSSGASVDSFGPPQAAFSVLSGNFAILSGGNNLTSPSTSITTSTPDFRFPVTSPGQMLETTTRSPSR